MKKFILAAFFAFPAAVAAGAADEFYVVKVSSDSVFIDTSVSTEVFTAGTRFEVFSEGEELVNPVTKAKLGKLKSKTGAGSVAAVHEKYLEGKLESGVGSVRPGQLARFSAPFVLQAPAAVRVQKTVAPLWQSGPINGHVTALALCDADGDGKNELAAVVDNSLALYTVNGGKLESKASVLLPQMLRPLSLEAREGKILLTAYHAFLERFQTVVYSLEGGQLARSEELKWLVRNLKRQGFPDKFVAQQLYADANSSRTKVRQLLSDEQGWRTAEVVDFPHLDWLYGFNFLDVDGDSEDEMVYITDSGKLRVQYKDGKRHYETGSEFARTPNRMSWKNQFLKFYPRVAVSKGAGGRPEACFLYNIPAGGILADSFGKYNSAELSCYAWTGTVLEQTWSAPLGGYAYDFDWGSFAGLAQGAVAAQISGDKSFVVVLPR